MEKAYEEMQESHIEIVERVSIRGAWKFIMAVTLIFFTLFISITRSAYMPPYTFVGITLIRWLEPVMDNLILSFLMIALLLTGIVSIIIPKEAELKPWICRLFRKNSFDILTRSMALIITGLIIYDLGPTWLLSEQTGLIMFSASKSILVWIGITVFIIPLFTNYGLDEFCAILLQPVMRPLFKVPGKGATSLVASLLMNASLGIIIAEEQFKNGHFSDREASIVMTTLCTPSIIAIITWAPLMHLSDVFPRLFISIMGTNLLLGVIMPRLWPLKKISNECFRESVERSNAIQPDENIFLHAIKSTSLKARDAKFNFLESLITVLEIILIIMPFVLVWGTLTMIILQYTPIFNWFSYPMGLYLQILGFEEGMTIAPVALVGFIEVLVPVFIIQSFDSFRLRFVFGTLAFTQMVFLTEVGMLVLKTQVSIRMKELLILFFERTLLAIPIIMILYKIMF